MSKFLKLIILKKLINRNVQLHILKMNMNQDNYIMVNPPKCQRLQSRQYSLASQVQKPLRTQTRDIIGLN